VALRETRALRIPLSVAPMMDRTDRHLRYFLRLLTRKIEPSLQPLEPDTYTRHHYDVLAAIKAQDARGVARAIASDIKATRALLRRLC
jgi:DNA-binding GntR family transcriptional regulator